MSGAAGLTGAQGLSGAAAKGLSEAEGVNGAEGLSGAGVLIGGEGLSGSEVLSGAEGLSGACAPQLMIETTVQVTGGGVHQILYEATYKWSRAKHCTKLCTYGYRGVRGDGRRGSIW